MTYPSLIDSYRPPIGNEIEFRIEAALDYGLIDEAHAAIVALDDLEADVFDCEPDPLEDTTSERVTTRCRCEHDEIDVC